RPEPASRPVNAQRTLRDPETASQQRAEPDDGADAAHRRPDENGKADKLADDGEVMGVPHPGIWTTSDEGRPRRHQNAERPSGAERRDCPELEGFRHTEQG